MGGKAGKIDRFISCGFAWEMLSCCVLQIWGFPLVSSPRLASPAASSTDAAGRACQGGDGKGLGCVFPAPTGWFSAPKDEKKKMISY